MASGRGHVLSQVFKLDRQGQVASVVSPSSTVDGGDPQVPTNPRSETVRRKSALLLVSRYQSNTERIANEADHIVHLQALHYFAAMTLHGFDAQLQPGGYLPRPMSISDHAQHLDLAGSQLVQRAADLDRV